MRLENNDLLSVLIGESDVDTLIVPAVSSGGLKGVIFVLVEEIYGEPSGEGSGSPDFSPRREFIDGPQNLREVTVHSAYLSHKAQASAGSLHRRISAG